VPEDEAASIDLWQVRRMPVTTANAAQVDLDNHLVRPTLRLTPRVQHDPPISGQ
jgi:hypothetical protein